MIQIPQHGQNKKQYKTMICRHFEQGNCSIGDSCQFAHGAAELRRPNDPLPCNVPKIEANLVITNFKTVLCKYHQQGFCKNGSSCSYAHGITDKKEAKVSTLTPLQNSTQQNVVVVTVKTVLDHLIKELTPMFAEEPCLQRARSLLSKSLFEESAQQIIELLQHPSRTEEERQKYEQLYENTLQLYQL